MTKDAPGHDAAGYYDEQAERQLQVGINDRHRSIQSWLERFGLAPGMDVLEIGCGIGTQTELIARRLRGSGSLLAIDVSPRSVELARGRLARWSNVEVLTGDAVELVLDRSFDVVVLPDVIEHIPIEQHPRLFAGIRRWLRDTGWVLIHMPNPLYLEWCHTNRPDLLQALDQPIFTELLLPSIQPNDLYIHYLETYAVWVPEGDYQVIVLRPRGASSQFSAPEPASHLHRLISGVARRARGVATRRVRGGRGGR